MHSGLRKPHFAPSGRRTAPVVHFLKNKTGNESRQSRLPALFRDDLLIFRGEWNLFADYFVSLQRNFNEILMRREINYVNAEQKVAQILGHSKDLITLSLSLSLSGARL